MHNAMPVYDYTRSPPDWESVGKPDYYKGSYLVRVPNLYLYTIQLGNLIGIILSPPSGVSPMITTIVLMKATKRKKRV